MPTIRYVLITGRQLEHWHTGSMTRRAGVLDAIEPDPVALVHPLDLAALGVKPGEVITLQSRRGEVALYARADDSSPPGAVFVPFCYYEAAINKLTNPALDPFGEDSRVQVLRGTGIEGRRSRPDDRLSAGACGPCPFGLIVTAPPAPATRGRGLRPLPLRGDRHCTPCPRHAGVLP